MSSCYSYQTMHFKNSSLDVDAVYVLTMENSDRLEKIKMELYRCKPEKLSLYKLIRVSKIAESVYVAILKTILILHIKIYLTHT